MLFFDQIEISVNNSSLIATSATIDQQGGMEPIRSLGLIEPIGYVSTNFPVITTTISYVIEVENEPVHAITEYLKTVDVSFEPVSALVVVGNMSGNYYLTNYALEVSPNSHVEATATFVSFYELSGTYQAADNALTYGDENGSGFAHYLTTYTQKPTNETVDVFNFSYQFNANWNPIFGFGRESATIKRPKQVQFLGGTESMSLVRDSFDTITYDNEDTTDYYNGAHYVNMNSVSGLCGGNQLESLQFVISGAKVSSINLNVGTDDFARIQSSFVKAF